ncbi:chromosome partitioning protein [Cryobacterium melibiosiphilum]|uniref:Chromosome partitioning protein n=1 Tax=Cryobacterium melibiosiphilum TaxID=995039 RepID=A0A3A5MY59_9MICO|nr:chromosome partitioning protein [Cryobacterium melibiosiphilum]RJT90104.1 chromosome partitioning protein [Cryobacterium melibiosiphilum]
MPQDLPTPHPIAPPHIRALVRSDATAELTVDGVSQAITATDDARLREEIITRVVASAEQAGRSLHVLIVDDDGEWPLLVHVDGLVEADGAGTRTVAPASAATATTATAPPMSRRAAREAAAAAAAREETVDDAVEEPAQHSRTAAAEPAPAPASAPSRPATGVPDPPFLSVLAAPAPAAAALGAPVPSFTVPPAPVPPAPVPTPAQAVATASAVQTIPAPLEAYETGETAPNLADFLGSRPPAATGPAQQGWQGAVGRITGGLVTFAPGGAELAQRDAISSVQRTLNGPRTIVVLNPKGGAHKTTATLLIAATFGTYRGGFTLAWDNNETMGTLGVRAQAAAHTNTAVDLLRDLERFGDGEARVGDLDDYVRAQGDAQFDALASDLDPAGAASIDAAAFGRLHSTLSRFYRVLVIDTGNNMRASNWEAAVETADQLVIVSTIREDTGFGAAALIDGLRAKGHADKVAQAVTILASPSKTADPQLSRRLHDHFAQLTRSVLDVPFDASLVSGGPLNVDALAPRTRAAWLLATASIAEGL